MTGIFDDCLACILKHEGGYVNHPKDPGGITNLGVTKAVWDAYIGRGSSVDEMRGLTPAVVAPLYKKQYWDGVRGDDMPGPLALCVFDFAVNTGVNRAARYLQRTVGANEDGHIGPATIKAVNAYIAAHGLADAVRAYQNARRGFYRKLDTFPTFGKGWLRRVDAVETTALRMIA